MLGHHLLVDTTAVFAFQQFLKQQSVKLQDPPIQSNINYSALLDAAQQAVFSPGRPSRRSTPTESDTRPRLPTRASSVPRGPADAARFEHMFAFVAINPEH